MSENFWKKQLWDFIIPDFWCICKQCPYPIRAYIAVAIVNMHAYCVPVSLQPLCMCVHFIWGFAWNAILRLALCGVHSLIPMPVYLIMWHCIYHQINAGCCVGRKVLEKKAWSCSFRVQKVEILQREECKGHENVRVMLVVLCQISRGSSLWVSSAIITSLVIGLGARCSTGMW